VFRKETTSPKKGDLSLPLHERTLWIKEIDINPAPSRTSVVGPEVAVGVDATPRSIAQKIQQTATSLTFCFIVRLARNVQKKPAGSE
jgi:hypothetical protein